jgi:hypothetical protein
MDGETKHLVWFVGSLELLHRMIFKAVFCLHLEQARADRCATSAARTGPRIFGGPKFGPFTIQQMVLS